MLILAWLSWWYTGGWMESGKRIIGAIKGVYYSFSVPTLIRTLFDPWKQIVASNGPNQTIQMKFRGLLDTLVSRVVGFALRSITLFVSMITCAALMLVGVLAFVVWPLIPLAVPALILKGLGLW